MAESCQKFQNICSRRKKYMYEQKEMCKERKKGKFCDGYGVFGLVHLVISVVRLTFIVFSVFQWFHSAWGNNLLESCEYELSEVLFEILLSLLTSITHLWDLKFPIKGNAIALNFLNVNAYAQKIWKTYYNNISHSIGNKSGATKDHNTSYQRSLPKGNNHILPIYIIIYNI